MYLTATITSSYHRVCGHGAVRGTPALAPWWTLLADGSQLPDGPPIAESASAGGQTATPCVTVYTPKPYGTYGVTFAFADLSGNPLGPVPFAIVAHGVWSPGNNGTFINYGWTG